MSRITRAFLSIVSVLFLGGYAAFAQSQATTGLIQGTVVDPNGAIVSGASVVVKNTETGFERTVTSNSDGFFSAPLLPLGKYSVTVTAGGFSNSVLENVDVTVGATLNLKVEMKVGGGTTVVDVSAEGSKPAEPSFRRRSTSARSKICRSTAAIFRASRCSRRAFRSFRDRTATRSRSTDRREFRTIFRSTARTPTTRFSANSAADSARRLRSRSNRSKNFRSCP